MLVIVLSAALIFCLLIGAGIAAHLVPIKKSGNTKSSQTCEIKETQPLTLLETLAKSSPNIPAIVQFLE